MPVATPTVAKHFVGKDKVVRATYDRLLVAIRKLGTIAEDPKQTSIHLNRRTALAGVATRKSALVLTIKASRDFASRRIRKHLQTSAHRWHLEVSLTSPADVDTELVSWLKEAYELSA